MNWLVMKSKNSPVRVSIQDSSGRTGIARILWNLRDNSTNDRLYMQMKRLWIKEREF